VNQRQQKALQGYVDHLRPALGLSDWEVAVQREPTEEGHVAVICPIFGCRFAKLRVTKDFFTLDRGYQRITVLHELLHCVLAQPQHHVEEVLPNHLDKDVASLFVESFFHSLEYAVDGLAVALAPRFPLPEFSR